MRKINLLLLLLSLSGSGVAQTVDRCMLSLDSCRTLAISYNKELTIAREQRASAAYSRKSAFTNYLPKVSVTGVYMHTDREISLLSDEQKATLPHLGDALSMPILNGVGQELVDALHTDTRNMTGAAVVLTQPLYMGGKIRAYNNVAKYAERVAGERENLKYQELVAQVDETYWSIVALEARKQLAEGYLTLVEKLDGDVGQMIAEGFATRADGLSVKVKKNEARVALIQVENGIEILKMDLCRLCGLPLETPVELADESADALLPDDGFADEESDAWLGRPELSMLASSVLISDEMVRIKRSEYLPSVVLTGGYLTSNPSVFNGFERKFKGTWNIGVAVNIPLLTWGDRFYKVKAAKAEATVARLNFEETREKIELQVSRNRQKLTEARERYVASQSSLAEADENLRYATLGMKEGVIPVSNVLEAQTAWLSARSGMISADVDLRLARVYLKKSLGTLK